MNRSVAWGVLALLVGLSSCGKAGEGTNIAEGKKCLAGSVCAAGLYCRPTGKETRDGDTFYMQGACTRQGVIGQVCNTSDSNSCALPLHCVGDGDSLVTIAGPGHCR